MTKIRIRNNNTTFKNVLSVRFYIDVNSQWELPCSTLYEGTFSPSLAEI
jgi:hypothetical protein